MEALQPGADKHKLTLHTLKGMRVAGRLLNLLHPDVGMIALSTEPAGRAEIECACCEICNYHKGKEPLNSEPPIPAKSLCALPGSQAGNQKTPKRHGPIFCNASSSLRTLWQGQTRLLHSGC
eukprot:622589-Pelagomonas_calceolata.AAC.1